MDCIFAESEISETIFENCTFSKGSVDDAEFQSFHFIDTVFRDVTFAFGTLIDSKFSDSKKSIEFEGKVYFNDRFDQIDMFHIAYHSSYDNRIYFYENIEISFPSALKYVGDIYDSNLDVFVKLEDGSQYTVVVGTPKIFLTLMNREGVDFLEPGCPFIIVRKLTMEVIEKAIHAHTQDNAY